MYWLSTYVKKLWTWKFVEKKNAPKVFGRNYKGDKKEKFGKTEK